MHKLLLGLFIFSLFIIQCKTADSPTTTQTAAPVAPSPAIESSIAPSSSTEASTSSSDSQLDPEKEYQLTAFLRQGDAKYAAGEYREALDFYKKAQKVAPDQVDNSKLIACLKALQEPSTRKK